MDPPMDEPAGAGQEGLGQRVASVCEHMCSLDEGKPAEPQQRLYIAQLVDLTGSQDFQPAFAVSMVVSQAKQFIPRLCREIGRLSGASETRRGPLSAEDKTSLAQGVYVLYRIVVKLIDRERELHKVGKLIYKNDILPHLNALVDGEADEAVLPGNSEEGELRSWVMTIVRWCFNYDKMKQLGKEEELYEAHTQLFAMGFYTKAVRIFGTGPMTPTTVAAASLLQGLADCPKTRFRAKLRKTGVILLASARLTSLPTFRMCSVLLYNMSRSTATHNSLREADLLAIAQQLVPEEDPEVAGPETDPIVRLSITLAVANVYGTVEDGREEAATFLARQQVSLQIVQMMENTLEGLDGIPEVSDWDVSGEEVAFMAFCLSQHGSFNQKMVDAGLLDALRKVLEHRDDSEVPCVRTLLHFSYTPELHESIKAANLVPLLEDLTRSPDMRVSDAAKGCLFQLGYDVKHRSFKKVPGRSPDDQPGRFNVFLSHRRSDAKDFARALFNLLTQRGYSTYLDFEYLRELSDLRDCVNRSDNFIFVLSDTVFDSYWCKEELMTAVENKCNVILVVKEGSKWQNLDGQDIYDFPPEHLIKALPVAAQDLFNNNVAIKHSDEYYQSFVEKVLDRLVGTNSAADGGDPLVPVTSRDSGSKTVPAANTRHSHSLPLPGAALPVVQVSSDEVVGKLKAVMSIANQDAKKSIIQANGAEIQELKHEFSKDLSNQQRQFSSELAHLRREVAAEISEVRREVATEMAVMRITLNEMSCCLRELSESFRSLAQQRKQRFGPVPAALPPPFAGGGTVGVAAEWSGHHLQPLLGTGQVVPLVPGPSTDAGGPASTTIASLAEDSDVRGGARNAHHRAGRDAGVHQQPQDVSTAATALQYRGGNYTRVVGEPSSGYFAKRTEHSQQGATAATPVAPLWHIPAGRHPTDAGGTHAGSSSAGHLPSVRQSARNRQAK